MKRILLPLLLVALAATTQAQEGTAELSKKAHKGFIIDVEHTDGKYLIYFKIPGEKKKKDEILYERYNFDNGLKFLNSEQVSEPKETKNDHPDRTVDILTAQVGGCTSFDVLSMKLRFTKASYLETWNYKDQAYEQKKRLSSETFKAKNDVGSLQGYAAFNSPKDGNLFVLAGGDDPNDKKATQFLILIPDASGDMVQKPVDIQGRQTLVYTNQLKSGDIVMVFAPNDGAADLTAYTYLRYAPDGNLKDKVNFKSPSPAMLIMAVCEGDNSVFFCGTSTKKDDAYNRVFAEYAGGISNPCYENGENRQDEKWAGKANQRMTNFHLLKFTGNQLDFASTDPIESFEDKLKTAPGEKHPDAYEGKKFSVENFTVTSDDEYLVAGQLTGRVKIGSSKAVVSATSYEDLVCLHFDKDGHLKAQYASNKMNTDKKSEIFPVTQYFKVGKDGKSLYWVILEVKGFKGYENFMDAYNDAPTFYPRYFPRIAKLDPVTTTLGAFKVLGDEDYYVPKSVDPIEDTNENSLVFIGTDKDDKNLWLGKYIFQ